MTVQDGLSELKLINQKLERNMNILRKYSSKMAADPDAIDDQKGVVANASQSCRDLIKRYLAIKNAIAKSNLETSFEFGGESFTIAEALFYKQGLIDMEERYLGSLNEGTANTRIQVMQRQFSGVLDEEQLKNLKFTPQVFYDKKSKMDREEFLLEFRSMLDRLVDKSNHHTQINVEY